MTTPAYLDIHAIQALPFANINRDDLGAPKTVKFGGAERTRVSSQSWKRMIRKHVEERIGEPTVRTRRVVRGVAERLKGKGWEESEADAAGIQVALSAGGKGIKLESAQDDAESVVLTTSVLLWLPETGIDELAELAAAHRDTILAEVKRAKKKTDIKPKLPTDEVDAILSRRSGTINLFGRMLAELPGANIDGAVQMAHAFTTHGTNIEYDFFTAVDNVEEALRIPGSGHMNTGMFSAGTFYRYANINLADLTDNLDGDTALAAELVTAFLDGFINTVPTGKKTATAPTTLPDLVHIAVRDDRPVSMATAFEEPVWGNRGHLADSVQRLNTHAEALNRLVGDTHLLRRGHTGTPAALGTEPQQDGALGVQHESYDDLVRAAVASAYPEGAQ